MAKGRDDAYFQIAQDINFDNILITYGVCAVWNSCKERVLFNDPTKDMRFRVTTGRGLNHVGYDNADVLNTYMEFRRGQFPGLFELLYESGPLQYVTIGEVKYVCDNVKTFFDGQTYQVFLQPALNEPLV